MCLEQVRNCFSKQSPNLCVFGMDWSHLLQWETWFASLISQIPCQPCQPRGWPARHRHRVAEGIHSITLPEIITLNCQLTGFLSGLLGKRYFWKTTKSVCSSGTASSFEEHWCCKGQLYQLANVGHSSDLGPFPDSSQERSLGSITSLHCFCTVISVVMLTPPSYETCVLVFP